MQPPEPARPDAVCQQAREAGATHVIEVSDRLILFYRRNDAGAVEFASAMRDDEQWTLTHWLLRGTHVIPSAAKALRGAK